MNEERNVLISPISGAIAAVCFFLPWVGCMGQNHSGSDLGGILWLVFFSAVGIVALFFHFRSKGELPKARAPIVACAAAGIAIMLLKYLALLASEYSEMFQIKFGSVATLFAFAGAIYGAAHLPREARQAMPPLPQGIPPLPVPDRGRGEGQDARGPTRPT